MNISTQRYVSIETVTATSGPADLEDDLREHHLILGRSGKHTLTGDVALLSDPDPAYPGALQVWSKTAEGMWIWVNPDGEIIESACPIGD